MLTSFPGRSITRIREEPSGDLDGYGMDVLVQSETVLTGWAWWPSATTEATQDRDTISTRYQAIGPVGSDLRSTDRVRLDDDFLFPDAVWRVDGDPQQHVSPFTGQAGGVTVWLEKVAG